MTTEELRKVATKVYVEYGEAIKKTFNLKGDLLAAPLTDTLSSDDTEEIKKFIACVREETAHLIKMIKRFSS